MALIKCAECGREISDKAAACIHCGCPIEVSRVNGPASVDAQRTIGEGSEASSAEICVDFHAILSGSAQESTVQAVFVKQLGRKVQFPIPNSMQVGQKILVKITDGPISGIHFRMISVTRTQAFGQTTENAQSAKPAAAPAAAASVSRRAAGSAPTQKPAPAAAPKARPYEEIKRILAAYSPNMLVEFLRSRRFSSILVIFIGGIGASLEGGMDALGVVLAVFGPMIALLILGRMLYPMHHLKKYLRKHRIDEAIRQDTGHMNVAISAYNVMPGKKMLAYIKRLNAQAGALIEQQLAAKKKK